MYGEMVSVRARATALREIADELTGRARSLSVQSEGMAWRSHAGDAFRERLNVAAREVGAHASALHSAAEALERHAYAVEGTKHAIQDAQAWVMARLNDALRAVRETGETTAGAVEHAIASAARSAPVSGSRDWLDFRQLFERRGWV
jgi:hypothetical protein